MRTNELSEDAQKTGLEMGCQAEVAPGKCPRRTKKVSKRGKRTQNKHLIQKMAQHGH